MRHEGILTQKGYLNFLSKFHKFAKGNTDTLVVEVSDKETIDQIDVPNEIVKLAEEYNLSIQDTINFILKTFILDWKMGRDNFHTFVSEKLQSMKHCGVPLEDAIQEFNKRIDFGKYVKKLLDKGESTNE